MLADKSIQYFWILLNEFSVIQKWSSLRLVFSDNVSCVLKVILLRNVSLISMDQGLKNMDKNMALNRDTGAFGLKQSKVQFTQCDQPLSKC